MGVALLMSLFVLKKVFLNISNFFGIRNNSQRKFGVTILLFLVASITANAEKISDFGKDIKPILQNYCYDCHGLKKTKGKVDLTNYNTWSDLEKNPELIEKLIDVLDKN